MIRTGSECCCKGSTICAVASSEVAAPILALSFVVFVLAAFFHRLRLGVDFTDESFSTALAYRFAQGDRPFVDEINSAQTAGILLWRFVWIYVKITGSSSGIMLFTRALFFIFRAGVAAAIFLPFLTAAGGHNLQLLLDAGSRLAPRPMSKLFQLAIGFAAHLPVSLWFVPAVAIVVAALKIKPSWSVWALPILVGALALSQPISVSASLFFCINAALLSPVFLAVERLWRESLPNDAVSPLSPALLLGPALLVLSFLAHYCFAVYRDDPVQALTSPVTSGPYRGLYTSPGHTRQSAELEDIFRRYGNADGKVLVLWELPGAYLFTKMRSAADSVWPAPVLDQEAHRDRRAVVMTRSDSMRQREQNV